MDGCMDGWMGVWMDGCMDGSMGVWMGDRWVYDCKYQWIGVGMYIWVGVFGWVGVWMDEWLVE